MKRDIIGSRFTFKIPQKDFLPLTGSAKESLWGLWFQWSWMGGPNQCKVTKKMGHL